MTDPYETRPLLDAKECIDEAKERLLTAVRRLLSCGATSEAKEIELALSYLTTAETLILARGTSEVKKAEVT